MAIKVSPYAAEFGAFFLLLLPHLCSLGFLVLPPILVSPS